jgi:hypothetical protein
MAETDRIAELARRVRALEDAREIEALHHRYVRCLADRDWQGCADCYADDAYVLSSPVIHVDGDQAIREWTWHRHHCEFRTSFGTMRIWGPWSEGRYRCEYARIDGDWKFTRVWFRVVAPDSDDELVSMRPGQSVARPGRG